MKAIIKLLFICFLGMQIHAQEKNITGVVTSAKDGVPLPGVSIVVEGIAKGTSTDFDGKFKIKVKETDVLLFSYIGFETKRISVDKQTVIYVALKEDTSVLEEVVVVGYGTTKKSSITGSISKVSGKVSGISIRGAGSISKPSDKVSLVKSKGSFPLHEEKEEEYNSPQSGLLTAGEINDLEKWKEWEGLFLNEEFNKYQQKWNFYLENKIEVVVTNQEGSKVNNIEVFLFNEEEELIMKSRTDYSGKATLFKDLNSKNDSEYYIVQIKNGKNILGKRINENHKELKFKLNNKFNSNDISVMFTIDATGSMSDEIDYLKSEIKDIISRLDESINEKKIALTFYKDRGEEYVVRDFDFTTNIDDVKEIISKQYASGGGDYEEAVEEALKVSMSKNWDVNSKAKLLFLLLDAPPHFTENNVSVIKEQIKVAQEKGIKIIPIVASGANKDVEFLMRFFSVSTNGTYVFLTDDSGIGNSHIKPTTNEFKVEKLNDLIVRLINKYSGVKNYSS